MRKQLGLFSSIIVMCAMALCWAGCSNFMGCEPECAAPCAVTCAAPCAAPCPTTCPPCAKPVACKYGPSGEICTYGVIVRASQPKLCVLGDTYVLDLEVTATEDVCDVTVNAMLPEGTTIVRSQPEGTSQVGGKLTWKFDAMSKCQKKTSRVWLKADREGDLCVCFCATATPVAFCSVLCAKPVLTCEVCGPEEVCPGDPVMYVVTVMNRGSCAAEDVVVTIAVPDGLEARDAKKTLTFSLCNIDPCSSKKVEFCLAAVKRGKICLTALASGCNANQTSCQWCVNVCKPCIELTKTGPKEVALGKNAEYQITISNPGDKPLTEIVVTDCAPIPTAIVEAKGATVNGNQAVWRVKELKPGEKQTFTLVLNSCTPGYYCNRVAVDNCQRCCATAEACTRWKGRAALNVCVSEMTDPVCIGQEASYNARVVNQGSEEDTNVVLVVTFPKEITAISGDGPTAATVSGQTITFAPVPRTGPRQVLEYRFIGRAKESGDARVEVKVSSDSIKTPIIQQESTIVN